MHDVAQPAGARVASLDDRDLSITAEGLETERGASSVAHSPSAPDLRERPAAGAGSHESGGDGAEEDDDASALLPPEMRNPPPGEPDPALQAKIVSWLHIQEVQGRSLDAEIRKSRCAAWRGRCSWTGERVGADRNVDG